MSFDKNKLTVLKAVMALLIVADHMANFFGVSCLRLFIEFGAPIVSVFFFISGYGLQVSFDKKGVSYLEHFFTRRFWKVMAPFLVATLIYCILFWSIDNIRPEAFTVLFTEGKPILPFSWYVIEILFFYLAFFFSYRFFHNYWRLIVLLALVLLFMIATFRLQYGNGWWISSLSFPTGIIFAKMEKKLYTYLEKYPARYWLILIFLTAGFCIFFLGGKILDKRFWTICYICIPLIVAMIVSKFPFEKFNIGIVTFLAIISYEIYLCQGIAMELFRGKFYIQSDLLFILSVYALTVALAYAVHLLSGLISAK